MKNSLKISVLLLIVACNNGIPRASLNENKDLWESYNAQKYAYDYALSCFCPVYGIMPARVVVNQGEIESILDIDTGMPLVHPYDSTLVIEEYKDLYRTIPELFDFVEQIRKEADDATVTFDEEFGIPSFISYDWEENTTDDEGSYQVSNVEIIE